MADTKIPGGPKELTEIKEKPKDTVKPVPNPIYGRLLGDTFITSYIIMFGYTTITLVEAIRTTNTNVRHIMNIETAVSLIAGLVYGMFIERFKQPDFKLQDLMPMRYLDWMVTTPLILLALMLFYNKTLASINYKTYGTVVLLNWLMLLSGYLGEFGQIGWGAGLGVGFLFFAAMLTYIFLYAIPKGSSHTVFWIFSAIWSGYGIAYMFDEEAKNIAYNILDITAKALFGVVLWLYFGKVLAFKD